MPRRGIVKETPELVEDADLGVTDVALVPCRLGGGGAFCGAREEPDDAARDLVPPEPAQVVELLELGEVLVLRTRGRLRQLISTSL